MPNQKFGRSAVRLAIVLKKGTIVPDMSTTGMDQLGRLLLGKVRGAVLELLLGRPDEEFHLRQIARLCHAGPASTQRELHLLAGADLVVRRKAGNQVFYRADTLSPIYHELRGLVLKTVGAAGVLRASLEPLAGRIRVAFIFGSVASGQQRSASDVDLMVVGEATFAEIAAALAEPQRKLAREINTTVYPPKEFAARMLQRHAFLTNVMAKPKIFLIGDEHELSGMVQKRMDSPARNKPGRNRRPAGGH